MGDADGNCINNVAVGIASRFSVTPVTAGGGAVRFSETPAEAIPLTSMNPAGGVEGGGRDYELDEEACQDIDDDMLGYITCERYDKPRRGGEYDSDGEVDSSNQDNNYTYEAMPRETNYVLSLLHGERARPTILELREDGTTDVDGKFGDATSVRRNSSAPTAILSGPVSQGVKFGWIRGVFIRCLLNIWGVLLFMRLSWVVAQAGLGLTVAILTLACTVVVITTLSMSAISTNGAVRGGGTYFLISRSLGPEFGGAVGIVFSLANAVGVGMNTVGFAEALVDLLSGCGIGMTDRWNDIRIYGILALIILLGITVVGMEWEARTQLVLLGVIIASFINFFIGSFIPPSDSKRAKGIVGFSADTFTNNFFPAFRGGETFMSMFGIFFPACTGIMAGANISGDLKNPSKAIPKGTLSAIAVSVFSYLACAMVVSAVAVRDASGSIADAVAGNQTTACGFHPNGSSTCEWGISNSYGMMTEISAVGPIITTGVFAASLSSALACLVSAPKIFQALCLDNIFPYIHVMARGYGKSGEPRLAYLLTFAIACGIIAIADLNTITFLVSNFFIGTYAVINYACFDASLSESPGFRPGFRFYNKWLSLFGALICVACMFMMSWQGALATMAIIVFLYMYVRHKAPDVNWGSSIQARAFKSTVQSALKLINVQEHVKNFRPQVLVLTGLPSSRPALVYFVHTFTKNLGMMICGHILTPDQGEFSLSSIGPLQKQTYAWFNQKHVKSFYSTVLADSFRQGVRSMLQTVGIGKMRPNMVVMGFTQNWMERSAGRNLEFIESINDAFDMNMGVGILRVQEGMDVSHLTDVTGSTFDLPSLVASPVDKMFSKTNGHESVSPSVLLPRRGSLQPVLEHPASAVSLSPNGGGLSPSAVPLLRNCRSTLDVPGLEHRESTQGASQYASKLDLADRFSAQSKQKMVGEIHVWWLYDDGGLTLLIPHILSKKPPWNGCKLKIFYLQGKPHLLDEAQRNMIALLSKFRIDFSDAVAVNTSKPPSNESVIWFNQMIDQFRDRENSDATAAPSDGTLPTPITNDDLQAMFEKTQRQIRVRELLKEHSSNASLVVMTLPVPKMNCNPTLYHAWLETLTAGMPPILLLRGNQQSVMTFYS
ncbi:Solute carrier family 12 member 2 [Hypsibius exemplaris]|uniref:Solute carrier family 12 member 2 n=1 Tax=Hypsibius exemplaris TaxID=2072580 RepID=A0A1W0XEF2_HYPEX|nr:Solute carrier family 12 member 2 [Hypsibius exemplaris]